MTDPKRISLEPANELEGVMVQVPAGAREEAAFFVALQEMLAGTGMYLLINPGGDLSTMLDPLQVAALPEDHPPGQRVAGDATVTALVRSTSRIARSSVLAGSSGASSTASSSCR